LPPSDRGAEESLTLERGRGEGASALNGRLGFPRISRNLFPPNLERSGTHAIRFRDLRRPLGAMLVAAGAPTRIEDREVSQDPTLTCLLVEGVA
jgi:hypothetical protein